MPQPPPPELHRMLERHRAEQKIREEQQGQGRPIIGFKSNDHQIVAVGNTVYYSKSWQTVPDFLADYLKNILDPAWGTSELAKPLAERHPIMRWYDVYCRYQLATIKTAGVVTQSIVTGVVACYLGLAYSLYLLAHNVELQNRLLQRLKLPDQFQGAYYELIVANILIKAGFELVLLDETDRSSRHCEYAAKSKRTGKTYWVEAKMRAVAGVLGKTTADGTADPNPLNRLVKQLHDALGKPAADERLIFIDLNTPMQPGATGQPTWIEQAARRLERYEKQQLSAGTTAYVFVTNFGFHYHLNDPATFAGFFFGLGIPDLNRPAVRRVSDAYRTKLKHLDVYEIGDALQTYSRFPVTFDGSLPSEALQGAPRLLIGETYRFGDPANGGVVGTVSTASVNEAESMVYFAVTDQDGHSSLFREPMSPEQMADWRNHKDSYFGVIQPVGKKLNNAFDLFEWFVEAYKGLSREKMLTYFAAAPDFAAIEAFSDEDLLYYYCEAMVAAVPGAAGPPPNSNFQR